MPTYVIGDIQGCYGALSNLLDTIDFNPREDRLWLVGDLVNRGPESARVLRWAMSMGDAVVTVLGNHDLHLLAVAEGFVEKARGDDIDDILEAPDRDAMLHWLRKQHLIHVSDDKVMVHAGLLPQWSIDQAQALAHEVETALSGEHYRDFLAHMYGNHPDHWDESHTGMNRLRVITNAMTRLRFCTPEGRMEFSHKGGLDTAPPGYVPWFKVSERESRGATVIFGHWSTLGLQITPQYWSLDTGCLWKGQLTAVRLEDHQVFQVTCSDLAGSRRL